MTILREILVRTKWISRFILNILLAILREILVGTKWISWFIMNLFCLDHLAFKAPGAIPVLRAPVVHHWPGNMSSSGHAHSSSQTLQCLRERIPAAYGFRRCDPHIVPCKMNLRWCLDMFKSGTPISGWQQHAHEMHYGCHMCVAQSCVPAEVVHQFGLGLELLIRAVRWEKRSVLVCDA